METKAFRSPERKPHAEILALKACLEELEGHAAANGMPLAANLIGAAADAITDEIVERRLPM